MDSVSTLLKHGFVITGEIGAGGFSHCYKVETSKYPGITFACKIMHKDEDEVSLAAYMTEISTLTRMSNDNIVRIYDHFTDATKIYMILEYCEQGSVDKMILDGELNEATVRKFAKNILQALVYIHGHSIAHHDIKPANFLIDKYGRAKLADFGIAQAYCAQNDSQSQKNPKKATVYYAPPEFFLKGTYDPYKADMWSFGVSLYEMITGSLPFMGHSRETLKNMIISGCFEKRSWIPQDIRDTINSCLRLNPDERPTAKKLLESTFASVNTSASNPKFGSYSLKKDVIPCRNSVSQEGKVVLSMVLPPLKKLTVAHCRASFRK